MLSAAVVIGTLRVNMNGYDIRGSNSASRNFATSLYMGQLRRKKVPQEAYHLNL